MEDNTPRTPEGDDTRTRLIREDEKNSTMRLTRIDGKAAGSDVPGSDSNPEPQPSGADGVGTPKKSKTWLYAVIAIVVVALGVGAYFLFKDGGGSAKDKAAPDVDASEVMGVYDADMEDFVNNAMAARYDKSDNSTAMDSVVEAAPVDTVAAVMW